MGSQLNLGGHNFRGSDLYRLLRSTPFRPNNLELIRILCRRRLTGKPISCNFIHEADAYSATPADLVDGREHAPGTDPGLGPWYFLSPASCHQNAGGGSTRMRQRAVRGGGGSGEFWRTEARKTAVEDTGGHILGYTRTLYYVTKIKNSRGTSSASFKRLGWCMKEFWLEEHPDGDADQQLVLCKVYRPNGSNPPAASFNGGPEATRVDRRPELYHADDQMYIRVAMDADHQYVPVTAARSMPNVISAGMPGQEDGEENPISRRESVIQCQSGAPAKSVVEEGRDGEKGASGLNLVMTFGGSAIPSAERMKEMAKLVVGNPVVVLSAMGKTTNNILHAAEKAVSCGDQKTSEIHELTVIRELHLRTVDELGLDSSTVSGLLDDLEHNLQYVARTKDLTPTKRHYLVSLGERMSTTIFSAYLNKLGKRTTQYEFDVSLKTTDEFTNADILESTYPTIAKKLRGDWIDDPVIPIVTSSVGKGCKSCAITTLGSDLTAMIIGKALGSEQIQIWKDIDGVLTGDPKICTNAIPIPNLTFDEAIELSYSGAQVLHPQSMQLAVGGGMQIIEVKNSYNPQAPGTMITKTRDMSKSTLSGIVLKSNIFMFNIASTGVLGQHDFKAQVFSIFKDHQISVDHEATSGCNICFTLDLSKLSSRELIQRKLDAVAEELEKVAVIVWQQQSIISLVGNVQKSSFILGKAFNALERIGVNAQKVSQRSSKVMNVSLVVHDSEAKRCVQVLHSAFLEGGLLSKVEGAENELLPVPVNSSAAASSCGVKRKADQDHLNAPTGVRQQRVAEGTAPDEIGDVLLPEDRMEAGGDNGGQPDGCCARELEGDDILDDPAGLLVGGGDQAMPQCENDPMPVGDSNGRDLSAGVFEVQREQHGVAGAAEGTTPDVDFLYSKDLMDVGGDNGGCPDSCWTGIGILEDAAHQLPPDNDLTAVGSDNVGDPDEIFGRIINEVQIEPIRDDGRDLARLHTGMPQNDDDFQAPDGADDDGDCARLSAGDALEGYDYPEQFDVEKYTRTPIDVGVSGFFAEPEQQQVLTEGGSALDALGEFSPDELLGPSRPSSDMSPAGVSGAYFP